MRGQSGALLWLFAVATACSEAPQPQTQDTRSAPAPSVDRRLGDLSELSPAVRRAFEAGPDDFAPLSEPRAGQWRALHDEPHQSVGHYWVSNPHHPEPGGRNRVYILPLGDVQAGGGPDLEVLRDYAQDFFTLEVALLDPVSLADVEVTRRDNGGIEQLLAPDLQRYLRRQLPPDAYALIGLTAHDLYPGEGWNYVFGMASPVDRTGVFSFHRYDPRFYEPSAPPNPTLVLERGLKIMTHEVGHMFGMQHCTYHRCLMNGANHAEEMDGAPVHLCPVCLRKLHKLMEFDPARRYHALQADYETLGLHDAAAFTSRRLARIDAP